MYSITHITFIVNPQSRGGKTGKKWDKLYKEINSYLDPKFTSDYILANGIGTGVSSTIEAIDNGSDIMISVGGEGTANEVVNGIFQHTKSPKYGFIRSGTVNDYLRTINWPNSIENQVELINKEEYRTTPLVKASSKSQSKVGLNIADIGVGAKIAYMASIDRKLTWIRGALRYQILSVRALFGWKNIPSTVIIDGEEFTGDLSLLTAGFSYYSGGYFLHPHSDPFGNKIAYTMAMNFSRFQLLTKMKMLERGEHTPEMENIYMDLAKEIIIKSDQPMLFEVDGEPFKDLAKEVKFEAMPNAIDIVKVG